MSRQSSVGGEASRDMAHGGAPRPPTPGAGASGAIGAAGLASPSAASSKLVHGIVGEHQQQQHGAFGHVPSTGSGSSSPEPRQSDVTSPLVVYADGQAEHDRDPGPAPSKVASRRSFSIGSLANFSH